MAHGDQLTRTTASGGNRQDRDPARGVAGQKPPQAVEAVVQSVRDAVGAVADPELPVVTLSMLGMVHAVDVGDDGHAAIELLPTFAGCPATEMIAADVRGAALAVDGVDTVDVRFRFSPPWTPDRISAQGHDRLREFGIAPPTGGGPVGDLTPEGRRSLPVVADAPRDRAVDGDGGRTRTRPCPYCGSAATTRESAFGPTPCRDIRFCEACQQPFEAFKQ